MRKDALPETAITPGEFAGLVEMVNLLQSESLVFYQDFHDDYFPQRARRQFGRAFFAAVEAAGWTFRRLALSRHYANSFRHTAGDLALLREETYRLGDKGRTTTERQRSAFANALLFTHRMAALAHGVDFDLNENAGEWLRFLRCVAIRNRLTHPKSLSELAVSDKEVTDLREGHHRYWDRAIALMGKLTPFY